MNNLLFIIGFIVGILIFLFVFGLFLDHIMGVFRDSQHRSIDDENEIYKKRSVDYSEYPPDLEDEI